MSDYKIILPENMSNVPQNEEYCFIRIEGHLIKIYLHDYSEIFKIPFLYENLFCKLLNCNSHEIIPEMLLDTLSFDCSLKRKLTILDLGAGNGLVGEFLKKNGIDRIIGIDINPEAYESVKRERPGTYNHFLVTDIRKISIDKLAELESQRPNCLVCVSALGFNDIAPDAFCHAFNLITVTGSIAFNIKKTFLSDNDNSGFAKLIKVLIKEKYLTVLRVKEYLHRLSISGESLFYVGIVGQKNKDYLL